MDLKDFTDLGNEIGRCVNDAIYNRNFDRLNRDIRRKVEQAFSKDQNGNFDGLNGKLYHGEEDRAPAAANAEPSGIPVALKLPRKGSSIFMIAAGCIFSCSFAALFLMLIALGMTAGSIPGVPSSFIFAMAASLLPILAASIVLAVFGVKRYGIMQKFSQYMDILGGRTFCSLEELAKKTGKSKRFTVKKLQKMIEKRFFLQGHLDDDKTCFIGTDEMYQQYLQARDSAARRASAQYQENSGEETNPSDAQMSRVIEEGKSYIKTIREANDAIYNAEISDKLYRMEHIVTKIFEYVKENPDQTDQLRRFMSYYMPTTEKLVNAYRQMDEQNIEGETIAKAKKEISQTLDTINEAYEKLYDSMYADVAMDVSSDIAVLKTLFAQEGLTENQMNGGKKG